MAEDELRSQFESILESSIVDERVGREIHSPASNTFEPRYAGSAVGSAMAELVQRPAKPVSKPDSTRIWSLALLFATVVVLFLVARRRSAPATDVPAQGGASYRSSDRERDEAVDPLFQPFDD